MDFTLLKNAGIDTDSAVERFVGNEALYAKMLKKFLDDQTFAALVKAVSEGSGEAALAASHTLKGVCGNLSIERLFELFSEQVVLMRADKWDEAYAMMTEITENYTKVTEALKAWFDMQ
ncbi:MAG: Hpt domain-containing protein [Oscillospiraceae bacterium]|nr:Hpt domain-containing protein [Oscillospiraceae bacterium]